MYALVWIFPGVYVLLSLIFFIFPNLFHKKKQTLIKAFKIAHRGGSAEGIENTLGAFKNAVDCEMQMLELDVRMTKDGQVVVIHDMELSRTCGVHMYVAHTDYKDLPLYLPTVPLVFSKDNVVFHADSSTDRKIPLLSEVFDKFPTTPINVDIKQQDIELILKVLEMIRERGREQITVWGSFQESTTKHLYKENPEIPLMASLWRVCFIVTSFYLGLLPFLPIKETFFEIPLFSADSIQAVLPPGMLVKVLVKIGNFLLSNRLLFWHLKARGIKIYMWVLNEEEEFDRAIKLGVDGIMTDYPSKLSNYVKKNIITLTTHDSSPLISSSNSNNSQSKNTSNTNLPEISNHTHHKTTLLQNASNTNDARVVREKGSIHKDPSFNKEVSNSLDVMKDSGEEYKLNADRNSQRNTVSEDYIVAGSFENDHFDNNNNVDYKSNIHFKSEDGNIKKRQVIKLTEGISNEI